MQKILQLEGGGWKSDVSRGFFLRKREYMTIGEVIDLLGVENAGVLDRSGRIFGFETLSAAGGGDITFFLNSKYIEDLRNTKAEYCLVSRENVHLVPERVKPVVVGNVHFAYAKILDQLYFVPQFLVRPSVAASAWIDPRAEIGSNVEIQPNVYIGERVRIGNGCKICANVTINHDCRIGEGTYVGPNSVLSYALVGTNVVIQNGANIGQCGLGFAPEG
ncbi:MAG: hypothetical protein LBB24_01670, partial [Rickettsiales bacterium]|nr:hypothetical protein [Rickettsiales bacterium]